MKIKIKTAVYRYMVEKLNASVCNELLYRVLCVIISNLQFGFN